MGLAVAKKQTGEAPAKCPRLSRVPLADSALSTLSDILAPSDYIVYAKSKQKRQRLSFDASVNETHLSG